ncbi:MAG: hypothetical protein KDD73_04560 [Anaerolineales bacterium]|nr:hypothetical protein [Anaerolineales bacterium]MCB9128953.1 hypothetical protein [Ardenticatenales bacterium]MCB9172814.1 hypothetical protein [Ardenticatenales bacterium]
MDTDRLLAIDIGESLSLSGGDEAAFFTYTRQPDLTINGMNATVYRNATPWEFPQGTRELRYYIESDDLRFIIGGTLSEGGTPRDGPISHTLFEEVAATFQRLSNTESDA